MKDLTYHLVRFIKWFPAVILAQALVLAVLAWILPGFSLNGSGSLAITAIVFTGFQFIAWPFFYRLSTYFRPLLFPFLCFGLAGILIAILSDLIDKFGRGGVHVESVWTGIVVAAGMTLGGTMVGALFSFGDDGAYDWFVTRAVREKYHDTPKSDVPGVFFLEIDGLAKPIFERALQEGRMPNLARWLSEDGYVVTGWEPDLSSQTSASQAGILLGDNSEIPAFRWYDKSAGALMVSSKMKTARALEHRIGVENGLLKHGASRWNVFSGGADDSLCTFSRVGLHNQGGSTSYIAYFANPYTLPRAFGLYFTDFLRERWQARSQVRRNELPRIHRSRKYALVRAATTTAMQDAAIFMLLSDIYRGVPVAYTTFFAYDEVAHHSGIDRPDAFKALTKLDHAFATLDRARQTAPRPYHLVVLSDHGQSMGATFRQENNGQTLGDLVTTLTESDQRVTIAEHTGGEDYGYLNLALNEILESEGTTRTERLVKKAIQSQVAPEGLDLEPPEATPGEELQKAAPASDVVVVASGNLGLISFPQFPTRMTYEEIVKQFPLLIPGLLANKGIGFLMVKSESSGAMVIGADGVHFLEGDKIEGQDPLQHYGPNAARHLSRTNGFSNAPDILAMSAYDPAVGTIAAFEELVGSHGGLGGTQTQPFVFHPASLATGDEPIVGAAALHKVLASWAAQSTGSV